MPHIWNSIRVAIVLSAAAIVAGCGGGGSGSSSSSNSANASSYAIGGTVSGLTGSGLTLNLNGSETLSITANGSFSFVTHLATETGYSASLGTQPAAQTCVVTNPAGTVAAADIANVTVTCTDGVQAAGAGDPIGPPSGNPSSADLIQAALSATTITAEQAIVYEMYADFADPRLPAQYKGDDSARIEGHAFEKAADYISSVGEANVSAATLDLLRPFITPPQYAGSYWQPAAGATGRTGATSLKALASPSTVQWSSVPGTNVVVWYKNAYAEVDGARAAKLVAEFDNKIWPSLTKLMNREPKSDLGSSGLISLGVIWTETDGRLDVYLSDDLGDTEGRTIAVNWTSKNTAARIFLNRNLTNGLNAVAAHEFMHTIQYSYDVAAASIDEYYTTKEATAAWASHYVYPSPSDGQWEHTYAKHYLTAGNVSNSYDDKSQAELFRYGAYVFPLYLEKTFGADIIRMIWESTIIFNNELRAIDAAITKTKSGLTFADVWPQFVAACWNQNTLNFFKDDGVTDYPALAEDGKMVALTNGFFAAKHGPTLPHASMAYYRVSFATAPSARSVTFVNGLTFASNSLDQGTGGSMLSFTGLSAAQRHGASMQIFVKVNGVWLARQQDFTNVPFATICRDDPAGNVDDVIFMYGNGEIYSNTPNYTGLSIAAKPPGLITTDIGCLDWTGNIQLAYNGSTSSSVESDTLTISDLRLHSNGPTAVPPPSTTSPPYPMSEGQVMPAGLGYAYSVVAGTAAWTSSTLAVGGPGCNTTGSGSYSIVGDSVTIHSFTNWTVPDSAAFHGLMLNGLTRNASPAVFQAMTTNWVCTDTHGVVTTGTNHGGVPTLDLAINSADPSVRITGGGLTVSGTGMPSGAGSALPGTSGAWVLTGLTH